MITFPIVIAYIFLASVMSEVLPPSAPPAPAVQQEITK